MPIWPYRDDTKNAHHNELESNGSPANVKDPSPEEGARLACDAKVLEMVGRDATVAEVLAVVLRDREYYAASGGGMTLSGADPLFQPESVKPPDRATVDSWIDYPRRRACAW